jgi:hypothetical protein
VILVYQLERRLRQHGVELRKSRSAINGPGGVRRRILYFWRDGEVAIIPCLRESEELTNAEVDRICHELGIDPLVL